MKPTGIAKFREYIHRNFDTPVSRSHKCVTHKNQLRFFHSCNLLRTYFFYVSSPMVPLRMCQTIYNNYGDLEGEKLPFFDEIDQPRDRLRAQPSFVGVQSNLAVV